MMVGWSRGVTLHYTHDKNCSMTFAPEAAEELSSKGSDKTILEEGHRWGWMVAVNEMSGLFHRQHNTANPCRSHSTRIVFRWHTRLSGKQHDTAESETWCSLVNDNITSNEIDKTLTLKYNEQRKHFAVGGAHGERNRSLTVSVEIPHTGTHLLPEFTITVSPHVPKVYSSSERKKRGWRICTPEGDCLAGTCPRPNTVHCLSRCVSEVFKCDGRDNCGDGLDEMDCTHPWINKAGVAGVDSKTATTAILVVAGCVVLCGMIGGMVKFYLVKKRAAAYAAAATQEPVQDIAY